jgi:hypothetical protein
VSDQAVTPGELKPCPACGKRAGELKHTIAARFPYSVQCKACGWSTDAVRLEGVAVKLWNTAKKPKTAKTKR